MIKKYWVRDPTAIKKYLPKINPSSKNEINDKLGHFIEQRMKPARITGPTGDNNYVVDIYPKWHGSNIYMIQKFHCPSPNAFSPYFEDRVARLQYLGNDKFNLCFRRYTGEWILLYTDQDLSSCFDAIECDHFFM